MVDWDRRYREGFYDDVAEPHLLLKRFWSLIPGPNVIDIASGAGRDSLYLAERGYRVWGLDKSQEALKIARESSSATRTSIFTISGDAHALPFKRNTANGVIVFYFLLRDIMGEIVDLLRKDGILMYETFLKRQNMIDKGRNPDFLLDDGELVSYFKDLDLLFYEETISFSRGKQRATARYVGKKR